MGSRPATPRKNVKYMKCQNASDRRRSRCLGVSPSAPGPRRRSRLCLFSAAAAEPGEASAPPRDPPRRTIWNRRPTTIRRTLPGLHEISGTWWLLPGHCFLTSAKYSTDLTVGDLTCHQTRRGRGRSSLVRGCAASGTGRWARVAARGSGRHVLTFFLSSERCRPPCPLRLS